MLRLWRRMQASPTSRCWCRTLLGPLASAVVNHASLVYSAEYGEVVCAPSRTGPLPTGRVVVIRPTQEWRTCATDFALVLAADNRGRLQEIDLTLSEP